MNTELDTAAEQARAAPSEDAHFIASVIGAAGDHDAPLLRRLLGGLDAPDLADVVEHVPLETARTIARMIGRELPAEFLAELSWERREEILPELPADYVGEALGQLDTDDAAAVAADIDEKQLGQVLAAADEDTRLAVEEALSFDEETAGRLMQREYVAAPEGAQCRRRDRPHARRLGRAAGRVLRDLHRRRRHAPDRRGARVEPDPRAPRDAAATRSCARRSS